MKELAGLFLDDARSGWRRSAQAVAAEGRSAAPAGRPHAQGFGGHLRDATDVEAARRWSRPERPDWGRERAWAALDEADRRLKPPSPRLAGRAASSDGGLQAVVSRPVGEERLPSRRRQAVAIPRRHGAERSMQILIADDDAVSRRLLQSYLQKWGYEVTAAKDGAEAWGLFEGGSFPMVITDWMMPELDGPGLIRRIRSAQRPGYVYAILADREIPEGGPGRGDGSRRGRLPDQAVRPGRAPGPAACRRADHPPGAEPARDQGGADPDREAREPGAPGGRGGPRDQQPARLRRQQPGRAPPGCAGRHARAGQVPRRRRQPGAGGAGARRRGGPPGGGDRPALPPREPPPPVRELGRGAATGPRHRPEPARFRPAGRGGIQRGGPQRRPPIHPGSTPPRARTRRRSAWRPTSRNSPRWPATPARSIRPS